MEVIAQEHGIPKEKVKEIIEQSLATAYKREYRSKGEVIRADFNPQTGEVKFYQVKTVVDKDQILKEDEEPEENERKIRFNPERHILLEDAQKIKPDIFVNEELEFELPQETEFGRIAAQTAKQIMIQKLHEIEKEMTFDKFKTKENEIISGIIQRIDKNGDVFVDLGKINGVMFKDEIIPTENYYIGDRKKFYVLKVDQNLKGISILLSRSHPKFLAKLFAAEVPEINEGIVEIKAIARDPGIRSKIAVVSHSEAIDPVGACVGQRGNRINTITSELSGEKIDVILWSDDPKTFLINALSPSKISDIEIKSSHEAIIYVPADQLSLTIGKNGQNVRLAAKLTGWRIEVRTIEEPSKSIDQGVSEELTTNLEKELPPEEIEKLEEQIEEQPKEQIETEEQLKIKEQSETEKSNEGQSETEN